MCFVWISEQTAIISLYSINWLVFITEMESVYCAVRTESLTIVQFNFRLSMDVPWLRRLVAGLSPRRLGSIAGQSMWDLWWTKWHCDRLFSQYVGFLLSVSFHQCSTLIFTQLLLAEVQMGEVWKPSKKQCSFGTRGALDRKVFSLFSSLKH
jgi:hypothetical protein